MKEHDKEIDDDFDAQKFKEEYMKDHAEVIEPEQGRLEKWSGDKKKLLMAMAKPEAVPAVPDPLKDLEEARGVYDGAGVDSGDVEEMRDHYETFLRGMADTFDEVLDFADQSGKVNKDVRMLDRARQYIKAIRGKG